MEPLTGGDGEGGHPDPIIESQFVPVALAYAAAKEIDVAALRTELQIGDTPASGTLPLALSRIALISARIADAVGDPHFGITLADCVPRGYGGVGELAARSAPTVGAALERCARYTRIIIPHQQLMCDRDESEIRFSYRVPGGVAPFSGRHTNEYAVAVFLRLAIEISGARPAVRRVWFAHSDTDGTRARIEQHFDTKEVLFDCDTDGISFDASFADQPVPTADPTLLRVLEEYARSLMPVVEEADPALDVLRTVERVVAELLVDGVPTLGAVAKRMGVGERTLQRQLQAKGTTFAVLVEGIRRSLAEQHLKRSQLSVSEIAYVLGYSDGRAFARAFGRWLGESPTEFRARHA